VDVAIPIVLEDNEKMSKEHIRTALIGCGRISSVHISVLKSLPGVDLVAACDLNERSAREQASRYSIPGVYTDTERMMSEVRPNVVHLLTPPQTHVSLASIAARHHAHMYIEKPFASNEADARRIVEAAENAGVHVCPGHSQLFDPSFLQACRRIRSGEIGEIVSVRAERGFSYEAAARSAVIPWSYTYDWGIFDNLMPHSLYVACHFLSNPGEPKVVGFNLGRIREAAVEEMRVLIPSASAVAEVSLSLCTSPEVNRVEIVGTRGRIVVDFVTLTVLSAVSNGLPSLVNRFASNFRTAATLTRSGVGVICGVATGRVKRYMGIRGLVAEFYNCLKKSIAPPVLPEDGLLNVRLMDQIKKSCGNIAKQRIVLTSQADPVSPSRILVTGASGFLGGHIVRRLSSDGIAVRAATRLMLRAQPLPAVEWIQCDLGKEEELRRALAGVETVFHCAALAGPPGSLEEYEEANVKGTVRLARLAAEAEVKTLVYVSSLSVYASPRGHKPYLDETAPYDPRAADRGVYTQSKLAAEQALLEYLSSNDKPRVVIFRAGTIYGPGSKLPVGRFLLPSSNRRPLIAGGRRVPMPLVYVDNLVDAMLAAADRDVPTGSIYNVVDSAEVDQGVVARTLTEVTRGESRPIFLPYYVVWTLMLGVDLLSLLRGKKLGTARFRLRRTLANMRFRCSAARKDLEWEPRVALADGLARTIKASTGR
jgi:nucleoside-diphosphate-sugar epimerase/predicted dehydrogenase